MSSPPCPRTAAGLGPFTVADDATTSRYFPSASPASSEYSWYAWGAGNLGEYSERPLPEYASANGGEAYRFLETGEFGNFVAADMTGARAAERQLCEDQDYGAVTQRTRRPFSPSDWQRLRSCMDRAFWAPRHSDSGNQATLDHAVVRLCGPGGHESSCVRALKGVTIIEGFRRAEHRVLAFDAWSPAGRHAGLAQCVELIRRAASR